MEKGLQSIKRKRRYFQRTVALLLALCISVSGLPVSGYAVAGSIEAADGKPEAYTDTGAGMAGGKPEIHTDTGNLGSSPSGEGQDIVRGFGSKIKDKKQKEIKVRVNQMFTVRGK